MQTSLWKFLTFTQNFGLSYSAFLHAWSLCLEEQFYFFLPIIILLIVYKGTLRIGWKVIGAILLGGIMLRTWLWFTYIHNAGSNIAQIYITKIYYFAFCRLDGLVFGVAIAILRNYHHAAWGRIMRMGNWWIALGIIGCYFTFYPINNLLEVNNTVIGFSLRSASFAALTLAALSPNTFLYKYKIPGITALATWSYAIYLTHVPIIYFVQTNFVTWPINSSHTLTVVIKIIACLAGGWLLFTIIESPFLKWRAYLTKNISSRYINHEQLIITEKSSSTFNLTS